MCRLCEWVGLFKCDDDDDVDEMIYFLLTDNFHLMASSSPSWDVLLTRFDDKEFG